MKKVISVIAIAMLFSVAAFAQKDNSKKKGEDDAWREKVRAEQIAQITTDLNLTEAEAQKFWPVYNDVQNKRREAYKVSFQAMKALREKMDAGADVSKELDQYLDSKKSIEEFDREAVKQYKKVLPTEKVAKLILSEERFRHNQIGKLGGRQGGPQGGPGMGAPGMGGPGKGNPAKGNHKGNRGGNFQTQPDNAE